MKNKKFICLKKKTEEIFVITAMRQYFPQVSQILFPKLASSPHPIDADVEAWPTHKKKRQKDKMVI